MPYKSEAAKCAAIIRKHLRATYPDYKFKVISDTYAGGDSVSVKSENVPPYIAKEVEKFVKRHQGGSFDGMNDIYNYCETDTEHSVKYAFYRNDWTPESKKILHEFCDTHIHNWDSNNYNDYQKGNMIFNGHDIYSVMVKEFWMVHMGASLADVVGPSVEAS